MKNFPRKLISIVTIIGLVVFFGVFSVMQYQNSDLTGYTGVDFSQTYENANNQTNQRGSGVQFVEENINTHPAFPSTPYITLTEEDQEFFRDNVIQCLETTPQSATVCKFYMPLGKRITPGTIQIKIGNNLNQNPSNFCEQDIENTVMCGYVQTPPTSGEHDIYIKIGQNEFKTDQKLTVLLPNDYKSKYREDWGPQFTIQYAGGYVDEKNDIAGSRCELYFKDIKKGHPMCYKLTILQELGIFSGQMREGSTLPYANLEQNISRVEFFTLAYRFLKQMEFLDANGDPFRLKDFKDIEYRKLADPANHWWTKPTSYLVERGIIKGYSDQTLRPFDEISEAEIAKILMYIKGYVIEPYENEKWYDPIVELYEYKGFAINPTRKATRKMAADILHFSQGI